MIFLGIFLVFGLNAQDCTDEWSEQVKELRQVFKNNQILLASQSEIIMKTKLRKLCDTYGIDGYIVPSEDAHLSEYVAPEYARRYFISGLKVSPIPVYC